MGLKAACRVVVLMPEHKFKIGERLFLIFSIDVSGGPYVIVKSLPKRDGEFEYQIKSGQ
jgi:hypothetical protein